MSKLNNGQTGVARLFTANGVVLSLLIATMLLLGGAIPNVINAKGKPISAQLTGELHNEGVIYVLNHLSLM